MFLWFQKMCHIGLGFLGLNCLGSVFYKSTVYSGDDINDIECLKNVKYTWCPVDADSQVIPYCNIVSSKKEERVLFPIYY